MPAWDKNPDTSHSLCCLGFYEDMHCLRMAAGWPGTGLQQPARLKSTDAAPLNDARPAMCSAGIEILLHFGDPQAIPKGAFLGIVS